MSCLENADEDDALTASAEDWLKDLTKQVAPAPQASPERSQSSKDMKERDRSRSPRRPDELSIRKETIELLKETTELLKQTLHAKDAASLGQQHELTEKRARITDLESKLASRDMIIDLKDKLVERMLDMIRPR